MLLALQLPQLVPNLVILDTCGLAHKAGGTPASSVPLRSLAHKPCGRPTQALSTCSLAKMPCEQAADARAPLG
jgi:hypothetical protein